MLVKAPNSLLVYFQTKLPRNVIHIKLLQSLIAVPGCSGQSNYDDENKVTENVVECFHALAIDEKRKRYQPVVWSQEVPSNQNLNQLWFAGSHGDVGGGYTQYELSDIALDWMINNCLRWGLKVSDDSKEILHPDPTGNLHNSYSGFWKLMVKK